MRNKTIRVVLSKAISRLCLTQLYRVVQKKVYDVI